MLDIFDRVMTHLSYENTRGSGKRDALRVLAIALIAWVFALIVMSPALVYMALT